MLERQFGNLRHIVLCRVDAGVHMSVNNLLPINTLHHIPAVDLNTLARLGGAMARRRAF
jgi:hypothetical protein